MWWVKWEKQMGQAKVPQISRSIMTFLTETILSLSFIISLLIDIFVCYVMFVYSSSSE